jgi:hypothetical protein
MRGKGEIALETVRRHIEGLKRLEWQRVLISDLIEVGRHDLVPATESFLALMEQQQATVERHLETLLREVPSMPGGPNSSTQ